jgi:uncharacterized integral membrane protein
MNAYLLGALFFVITIVGFMLQNNTQVTVSFLTWTSPPISLAVVILISTSIGALITFLLNTYRAFKTGQKLRNAINQNRQYEKEIQQLKGQKEVTQSEN